MTQGLPLDGEGFSVNGDVAMSPAELTRLNVFGLLRNMLAVFCCHLAHHWLANPDELPLTALQEEDSKACNDCLSWSWDPDLCFAKPYCVPVLWIKLPSVQSELLQAGVSLPARCRETDGVNNTAANADARLRHESRSLTRLALLLAWEVRMDVPSCMSAVTTTNTLPSLTTAQWLACPRKQGNATPLADPVVADQRSSETLILDSTFAAASCRG